MSNWIIFVTYHEVAGLGAGITMCWVRLIEICRLYVQLSMETHICTLGLLLCFNIKTNLERELISIHEDGSKSLGA